MGAEEVAIFALPIAAWAGVGLGLAVSLRRSLAPLVLRLAAAFVALWALLATTAVVWFLADGGATEIDAIVRSPATLATLATLPLWALGALGAFVILGVAFALNQLVGHGLLRLWQPTPLPWPSSLPRPPGTFSLLEFPSARREAFSLTLVEWGGPWGLRRHELIFLSRGLIDALTPEERLAVIAHELGHIRRLDSRYLTFLRTLARMTRWDPVVGYATRALVREEEFRADHEAVALTGNPLALARALFKVASAGPARVGRGYGGFVGRGIGRSGKETGERIRRLLALASKTPEEVGELAGS